MRKADRAAIRQALFLAAAQIAEGTRQLRATDGDAAAVAGIDAATSVAIRRAAIAARALVETAPRRRRPGGGLER